MRTMLILAAMIWMNPLFGIEPPTPSERAKAAIEIEKVKSASLAMQINKSICVCETDYNKALNRAVKEDTALIVFVGDKTCAGRSKPLVDKGMVTYKTDSYDADQNGKPKEPRIIILSKGGDLSLIVRKTMKADATLKDVLDEAKKAKATAKKNISAEVEEVQISFLIEDTVDDGDKKTEKPKAAAAAPTPLFFRQECQGGVCHWVPVYPEKTVTVVPPPAAAIQGASWPQAMPMAYSTYKVPSTAFMQMDDGSMVEARRVRVFSEARAAFRGKVKGFFGRLFFPGRQLN